MARFNERHGPISRKYVAEQGMIILKSSENINRFGRTPSFCFTIIASKMLIFEDFVPLKMPVVTTFSETRLLTPKTYAAEDTKSNPKQFKPYKLL